MERRQRVMDALCHKKPDRTPTDFQAVAEIWDKMFAYFETDDRKVVLDRLDIDCAWVDPEVSRGATQKDEEGYLIGWGGSRIKIVANPYGQYQETVKFATDGCQTKDEIDRALSLPDLDEWDFSPISEACRIYGDRFLLGGFASAFYYPTLVRNIEDLLADMVLNKDMVRHLVNKCFEWHMDYHQRLFKAAGGRLDAMQIADDFATQLGLLISVDMFREFFREPIRQYVELAKKNGAVPFMHCCGSAYHLIREFIDIGIKILDPVQTAAANMEPGKLKSEFGSDITFHGAGETQHILPGGTQEEVRQNARFLSGTLGENGGYILSSCHFLQADVPVQNILAFYEIDNRKN